MIICKDEKVKVDGNKVEVLTEATCILRGIYESLVEHEGEEEAKEQLRELFMLAVMSAEEIKEATAIEEKKAEAELLEREPPRYLS